MKRPLVCLALLASSTFTLSATAEVRSFSAKLESLNGSGAFGVANLSLDNDLLTVNLTAFGLESDQLHIQHIHGAFSESGTPINSSPPTLAQDTDNDGFVEVAEGSATYGPVLLNLTSPAGSDAFPTAPLGQINYSQVFDLSDQSQFGTEFSRDDLFPLSFREIVIHGMTVDGSVGAGTPGEVDGTPGYKVALPVASGEIFETTATAPIPEPETYAMLLSGLGLLGYAVRRRKSRMG